MTIEFFGLFSAAADHYFHWNVSIINDIIVIEFSHIPATKISTFKSEYAFLCAISMDLIYVDLNDF